MLRFSQFVKQFNRTTVLSIESSTIPEGVNYIIGGNGTGKTTLLRILAGRSPFEGDLCFLDRYHLTRDPVFWRRHVTFGEAEPTYPANAYGNDLVRIFTNARRGDPEVVRDIIKRFKMETFLGSPIGSYSAGMKKKLSLLLAFAGQPKLILLDEPSITLDSDTRQELKSLIALFSEQKCSFIISSHLAVHDTSTPINPVLEVVDGDLQNATPERIRELMPSVS